MDYSVPQLLVSIANTGNVKITTKKQGGLCENTRLFLQNGCIVITF